MTEPHALAAARWIAGFENLDKGSEPALPDWLRTARRMAFERFVELGFPTTHQDDWRRTSVAPIASTAFTQASAPAAGGITLPPAALSAFASRGVHLLVFVNGHFAPELSRPGRLPEGVRLGSLAQALGAAPSAVEPHLGRLAPWREHPFAALNTAFIQDGAFLIVPEGRVLDTPVHIACVTAPGAGPLACHPRHLIVLGEGAQVRVVETYLASAHGTVLTNALTELLVGENASIEHTRLQDDGAGGYHLGMLRCRLARSSTLASHAVSLGGALVRSEIHAAIEGEGADCTLNGLFLSSAGQLVDNHTVIDHVLPRGASRELYKGIVEAGGRGVFDGRIVVREGAEGTDARQVNKNLLLSDEAVIDAQPQLEIYNNDVKCAHAATIGRLDEDALFYMRSRGVGYEESRRTLTRAFANDILQRIQMDGLREGLERSVNALLERGAVAGRVS